MCEDYKIFLEEYLDKNPKVLKDYESHYSNNVVRFLLHFYDLGSIDIEKEFKLVGGAITTTNMHLFDEKGVIKKYGSVGDIMRAFYDVRLAAYQTRKDCVAKKLEDDLALLTVKAKFISDVCEGVVVVANTPRKAVVERLEQLGYPPSADALLGMQIHNMTTEKRDDLLAEIGTMRSELTRYQELPVKSIWLAELAEVEAAYVKSMADFERRMQSDAERKPASKKPASKKAKK